MKKRNFSNYGLSTILLGFTMVCIVTFSVLSFVTANSDYKLSKRVASNNTLYYESSKIITEEIATIDSKLCEIYANSSTEDEYYSQVSTMLSSFSGSIVEDSENLLFNTESYISDSQYLEVQLQINYPTEDTDNIYSIKKWQLHTTTSVDEDNTLNLIGGEK